MGAGVRAGRQGWGPAGGTRTDASEAASKTRSSSGTGAHLKPWRRYLLSQAGGMQHQHQ